MLYLPTDELLWGDVERVPKATKSKLSLGYLNCTGATFVWTTPLLYVGIAPVALDGSVAAVPAEPIILERPPRP